MSYFVQQAISAKSSSQVSLPCVGDKVDVHVRIFESGKERIQVFQGVVLKISGKEASRSFTIRKISNGVGVERTFPIVSPILHKVTVLSKSRVRRAKLYYIRNLKGKASRLTSAFFSREDDKNKETSQDIKQDEKENPQPENSKTPS